MILAIIVLHIALFPVTYKQIQSYASGVFRGLLGSWVRAAATLLGCG